MKHIRHFLHSILSYSTRSPDKGASTQPNSKKIEQFIAKNHKKITIDHYEIFFKEIDKYLTCLIESKRHVESKIITVFSAFSTITTALIVYTFSVFPQPGCITYHLVALSVLFSGTTACLFCILGLKPIHLNGYDPVNFCKEEDNFLEGNGSMNKLKQCYVNFMYHYQTKIDANLQSHNQMSQQFTQLMKIFIIGLFLIAISFFIYGTNS